MTGPGIVVKADEQEFAEWLSTEEGFLSAFVRLDDDPIEWEPYQRRFFQSRSRFRWVTKSRQVGYSFAISAEALARAHLRDGYTANFVSYNREDAKEKVLYAREFHESLPLRYQKRLVRESLTELVFASNKAGKRQSRIISHPSKAPRGKKGDIYLDELAHYARDRDVYNGSTALIARVPTAQVTGCSTPLGGRGVFHEYATDPRGRFSAYWRQVVPWWLCSSFCVDVPLAARLAPSLETVERLERFGAIPIIEQFDALPVEDFRQEFECAFLDETQAYFPYDLLVRIADPELVIATDLDEIGTKKTSPVRIGSGRLVAGVDIGRVRDATEIALFEDVRGVFKCRALITLTDTPFGEQEGVLRRILDRLPVVRMSIDSTGLGLMLSENLARDYDQVQPCPFSNEAKERWCVNAKIRAQRKTVVLPADRGLISQWHSIRRKILPSGKVQFEGHGFEPGGRHHADQFWACALAIQQEVEAFDADPVDFEVLVIGGGGSGSRRTSGRDQSDKRSGR